MTFSKKKKNSISPSQNKPNLP